MAFKWLKVLKDSSQEHGSMWTLLTNNEITSNKTSLESGDSANTKDCVIQKERGIDLSIITVTSMRGTENKGRMIEEQAMEAFKRQTGDF